VQVAGVFEGRDDGGADGGQVGGPAAGAAGGGIFPEVRSHPHIETTDEPGAEAKGGLAMYQGQRP
jgi:hypothetical protein